MELYHWDETRDGPLTEQTMRAKLEGMGYSVTRYVYPPGCSFPDHTHEVDKIDGVLSGRFRLSMEGESVVLEAGDLLVVPKGVVHAAEVVGDQSVTSLDAVQRG
jgi:quercetin dioxygenase-like cupin family protein